MPDTETPAARARFAAFRHPGYRKYWISRFLVTFATQVISVSVGWHIYDLTRDPFYLGLVGIIQFAPALLLVLVTGAAADRFGRRLIMALAASVEAICALLLLLLAAAQGGIGWIFAVLAFFGLARAFFQPAQASLVANLVPPEDLANAIALNSSAGQTATITGPVVGGLLYGVAPELPFATALVLMLAASGLILSIPKPVSTTVERASVDALFDGFRYIWREKIVLGAISLDLFAVLVGGAVSLMPVFARDILELGPWGLGMLRAAPAIGAISVAIWLAAHPLRDHAGLVMFVFVALYGVFTIVFGLSTAGWLSIAALIGLGAADMVSVYIRQTLIQLWTPDRLRGRVSAVNTVFIGASNELGEFRAGSMAALIGTVPAVVLGGIGAIAIAGLWARLFPHLRGARHLDGRV